MNISMISIVLAAALVGSVSGVARADDSSNSRFGSDGYAYFHQDKPIVSKALPTFWQSNPKGVSESQYQTFSSGGPEWQPKPVVTRTQATFRESHPKGLALGDYEALSSNSPRWQAPDQSRAAETASTHPTRVAKTGAK